MFTRPALQRTLAAQSEARAAINFIAIVPRYLVEGIGMVLIALVAYSMSFRSGGISTALPVLGALALGAQKLLPQMQQAYAGWASLSGTRQALADVLEFLEQADPSHLESRSGFAARDEARHRHAEREFPLREHTIRGPPGA